MPSREQPKRKAIQRTLNWWYCDNIVHPQHQDMLGLLSLNFPRVFILIRNFDSDVYYASFEEWKATIAEVNFLDPEDRPKNEKEIESILVDAWNFMALQEEEDERMCEEYEKDDFW